MNGLFSSLQPLMAPTGAAGGAADAGSMIPTLITFGAVFVIFYFLIIRPQNKKQKETQKMLDALKKGDRVQSIGGIRGTIVSIKEDSVVVKVDDNAKLEFVRSAISGVVDQKTEEKKDDKKADKKSAKKEEEPTAEAAEKDAE